MKALRLRELSEVPGSTQPVKGQSWACLPGYCHLRKLLEPVLCGHLHNCQTLTVLETLLNHKAVNYNRTYVKHMAAGCWDRLKVISSSGRSGDRS